MIQITIPENTVSIGEGAFSLCYSLKSVYIPASVTSIGYSAFSYSKSLAEIYYSGTSEQWAKINIDQKNNPLKAAAIHFQSVSK